MSTKKIYRDVRRTTPRRIKPKYEVEVVLAPRRDRGAIDFAVITESERIVARAREIDRRLPTHEQARQTLIDLKSAPGGGSHAVRELLAIFGERRLLDLHPTHYGTLMARAEVEATRLRAQAIHVAALLDVTK